MKSVFFCWLLFMATIGQPLHAQQSAGPVQLDFREKGKGNPTTILFLHGYSDSWFSYSELMRKFPDKYHCIALSMRGHGNSPSPSTGYGQDDMVEDVIHFMNQHQLDKVVLVGHSMGSSIAMKMAVTHPERTISLVLLAAFASFDDKTFMPDLIKATEALKDPVNPLFIREFQESTIARKVSSSFLEAVIQESQKLEPEVWKQTIYGLMKADYELALSAYTKPVLLIWGEKDMLVPLDDQERLIKALPDARLHRYEKTGHAVHWERPGQVVGDITAFLEFIRTSPE